MEKLVYANTVNVRNPNVQISAFSDLVWLLNGSDFRHCLKTGHFCPDFTRSVPNIVRSVLFLALS